jgi:hypothetical protein
MPEWSALKQVTIYNLGRRVIAHGKHGHVVTGAT